jgi:hypothetical protein
MIKPLPPAVFAALALIAGLPAFCVSAQSILPTPPLGETPFPSDSASTISRTIGAPKPLPDSAVRARRLIRSVDENTDNVKAQGAFGAQLWLVEGRQFFEDWRKPETPSINPVNIVQRGLPIYTAIIFYGAGRDQGGLSNVTYTITVKRPDGSVYQQRNDAIGWQNLAASDERQLLLGRDSMGIIIGPDDPAGRYTVEAVVRDNAKRTELSLMQPFVVP